jgi:hypothetical protein
MRHQSALPFSLSLSAIFMVCVLGCKDEPAPMVVDAMVDVGPECDASTGGSGTCRERYGERFFCTASGTCQEIAPCEEQSCCAPGPMGDVYCVDNYGAGSICQAGEMNGECTERACVDCTSDSEGHSCCHDALGRNWYCGGEGRCEEAPACNSPECCVPGPAGDEKCRGEYGEGSACAQLGSGGSCLMPSAPPCAGCDPNVEGHACCRAEFNDLWFCGLNGTCDQSSGCMNPECCVPGEAGDAQCAETFGPMSTCSIENRDGRCNPATPPGE